MVQKYGKGYFTVKYVNHSMEQSYHIASATVDHDRRLITLNTIGTKIQPDVNSDEAIYDFSVVIPFENAVYWIPLSPEVQEEAAV